MAAMSMVLSCMPATCEDQKLKLKSTDLAICTRNISTAST